MFLTEISDLILIDEIINEKKYTHFLTHCENRFCTESGFASKIYTSKNIARILYRHKKIPINVFNILQSNHTTKIELSNGHYINVTLFEGDKYTNNICLHFENSKNTLFYCGYFRNIYGLFKNQLCFDLSKIGLDYLYLDNTRANAEYISSVNDIGITLKQIMKKYPNYKIIISLPNYGYEDLLVSLLLNHQFKIFIGIHQKDILTHLKFDNYLVNNFVDAELIIRKDIVDMDCIKERYTKKHYITVRIVEYDKEVLSKNFEHLGLYQIHYSPHITQFEIFSLIAFLQPKYIREIFPEFSDIPKFLKEASLALCAEQDEKNNNNSFEDNAIKSNSIQNPSTSNETRPEIDIYLNKNQNDNNNNKNNIINTNINKSQVQKHSRRLSINNNELEFIKPSPKSANKNSIKELYHNFALNDNDNGDYFKPNNKNVHKNNNNHHIPIWNSDHSESKSLAPDREYISNELNLSTLQELTKLVSPRIGTKRLIGGNDDKYHIPKEKHRKLLVNSSIKEASLHIPDIKLNIPDMKLINKDTKTKKSNGQQTQTTSQNSKNQTNSTGKSRINRNRTKIQPRKIAVNIKIPNYMSPEKRKDISIQKNKNVMSPSTENLNKSSSTVDYSKQKTFKRNVVRQIEYINSDEDE